MELAKRVQEIVGVVPHAGDYFRTATAATAQLIQRNYVEAASLYASAVAMARTEVGSHNSTWSDRELVGQAFPHFPDARR